MCPIRRENTLTQSTEKLYLDLMYSRADARLYDMPYIAHLLNLACEEMEKLVDAERRAMPVQAEWNAFQMYPGMK